MDYPCAKFDHGTFSHFDSITLNVFFPFLDRDLDL